MSEDRIRALEAEVARLRRFAREQLTPEADIAEMSRNGSTWNVGYHQGWNDALREVAALTPEALHRAIVEVDGRGCGGTHLMGYGYCQILSAALSPAAPETPAPETPAITCDCEDCDDGCVVGADGVVPEPGRPKLPAFCADCSNDDIPEGYPCHAPETPGEAAAE